MKPIYDEKQKLRCPECDILGSLTDDTFQSNLEKVNVGLAYLCKECNAQFDVGSCDGCGKYLANDLLVTDEAPFLCNDCWGKKS